MGNSNSVVRMDMKSLIGEDIKLAAISYSYEATETLTSEYTKARREENPLYMAIEKSDAPIDDENENTEDEMEIWAIVLITLAVIAVILAIIAFCCCKRDTRYRCVCCCACCQCRSCIQSRQTSDESDESDNTDEPPVDRINEV